ncbi:uncharacterized protein [Drosophila takahashii]|uniref:uncharacterized protein n=1 Tax=Drosophila takahashii TaxID=29030 RepID=UPI001CF8D179|nr:uncharacterized protein LOC108055397 [Drosophila takahashii]
MAWKTFTLLPLLWAATLANPLSSTVEPFTPPAPNTETQPQVIKEEHFPAMAPPQAIESSGSSGQPILLQPPPPPALPSGDEDALRRRTITYDQRQEGQYNIRADLENFMILLIPPGPQEGISLLELLGRGNTKGSGALKRKHPLRSNSLKSYYQKSQLQKLQQQQNHQQSSPAVALPEFIEGRSPYHVDISASDPEQAQRLQRQQVDVLPPQLIPMPQLIKPFHLEAEPELIQALPPVSASSSAGSNLLESYNHPGSQYFRSSRSLRGDSYLDTNRLTGGGDYGSPRSISAPIYRSDLGASGAHGLYPPIDVPSYFSDQPRSWQLDEEPTRPQAVEPEIVSFDLLADDDLTESRTLLRDGLARCARGERRDSYGACRKIEGY